MQVNRGHLLKGKQINFGMIDEDKIERTGSSYPINRMIMSFTDTKICDKLPNDSKIRDKMKTIKKV